MWKWIAGLFVVLILGVSAYWFSLDKSVRYLIMNQPSSDNPLFWTTEQRDAAFRATEQLKILPLRIIKKGETTPLKNGPALNIDNDTLARLFSKLRASGLVVLHKGELRFEKYGLDFTVEEKWTSFSVAKSFTSTLVGAAIKDGYINSLDDKVTNYVTDMRGSAYDDVTIEQLLTMTSGVAWNESYTDPNSDVNLFNTHVPDDGIDVVASYMRKLPRATIAGSEYRYSTGETNLIGLVVSEATGKPLTEYLSEKVWQHIGAEKDASWLLNTTGHEISGCCIQATTRDYARFGHFISQGAMVDGESILADGYLAKATSQQADFGSDTLSYGYQWWIYSNGSFDGRGIFGQGIYIDPKNDLVIAINANWPVASASEYSSLRNDLYELIQAAVADE
ncbi:serine hydrolase domain-containing protein [Glaciecola petra]|uniref:Serine hydrolase n=1 Tax=Glaciecola petra TaxID=3075602 RepID=A0ABU2ZQQ1_9ALTE|nr:serine hydrolase [Aestuariibacter sp. P117]MDT0594961.1 serine hydrolase [Aestuariibacter sp. P117]